MVLMNISNLRDAVVEEQSSTQPDGVVESFMSSLDDATRNELEDLLSDRTIQTRALWKVLKANGLNASETTFSVYRRGRIDRR